MLTIPAYLLAPPSANLVSPPIETRPHELPLADLPWEDFERLCLRLVQTRFSLERCEIYGVPGQKQEGIDIFARKDNGTYATYQCKRYQQLHKGDLKKLVGLFQTSEWAAKSEEFILCTSAELNSATVQDMFNELHKQLAAVGISLEKWDRIQLQRLLKDQPAIVYDFFGASWVKVFNGETAYAHVNARRKLDNAQVATYRRDLRTFYTVVFNQYDPGLPMQELNGEPLRLESRFIVPDVYEDRPDSPYSEETAEPSQTTEAIREQRKWDQAQDLYTRQLLPSQNYSVRPAISVDYLRSPRRARARVDQQLAQHSRTIILGDPGAGKSTLLRYLALDLLSDTPVLVALPQTLGTRLPVWLPFAYITRQISQHETQNLPELLRQWFASMSQPHLFELVQQALEDERLLLLIDGVDEWTSLAVAGQALARIEIQANLLDTPVIYSSRPYGFRLLREHLFNIQQLELAPFSRPQQEAFVSKWFEQWLRTVEPSSLGQATNLTDDFFTELHKSSDLAQLAENPLLLSILVTQKLRDSVLPRNRLNALRDITDYLVNRRPSKRRHEAGLGEDDAWDFPFEDVFAELAFHLQQHSNDGTLLKQDAARVVEGYLLQQADYEPARARKVSRELLELSANNVGIIIEKSADEWAFRHRQFQEYLAAKYLNDSNPDRVREVLHAYAAEQPWNQVILTFFGRIPAKRDQEFTECLAQLVYDGQSTAKAHYLQFLRYDIQLRLPNAPLPLAKAALAELQREFELEQDDAIRKPLLRLLLGAAENPRLKRLVFAYFGTYFPSSFKYSDFRLPALKQVAPEHLSAAQQALLWQALLHGNPATQLQASNTLGAFMELPAVAAQISAQLEQPARPDVTALALNVLAGSAVPNAIKQTAVADFAGRVSGNAMLFWLKLKVQLGTHSDEDLTELLTRPSQFGHELQDELYNLLVTGWPTNSELLTTCLTDLGNGWHRGRKLERSVAWRILFHCFNQEERVIDRIIQEVTDEQFPFNSGSLHQSWQLVAHYLKDHPRLVPVVDTWLAKQKVMMPGTAFACLVGRTLVAKDLLLNDYVKSSAPHWPIMALMEGWGNDPQIRADLKTYFHSSAKNKDYAAHYISQLFADEPQTGMAILEEILFDRRYFFRERALLPLIQLDRDYFERDLLIRFLDEELPLLSKETFSQYYIALGALVEQFGTHGHVRALVFALNSQQDSFGADLLIRHYPTATEAINTVVSMARPLAAFERLQLIAKLGERYVADDQSLAKLANFELEADDRLRCEAAVRYFQFTPNKDDVRDVCTRLAFYRGINHEANRQLSFIGFLILDELPAYFALRDGVDSPNPDFTFNPTSAMHGHEAALLPVLALHFDRLYASIGSDFSRICHSYFSKDEESVLGALARYASPASSLASHLQSYAIAHVATLLDPELLALLAESVPGSDIIKQIALRLAQSKEESQFLFAADVLGRQFVNHPDVKDFVSDIHMLEPEPGKVIAATIGWPTLPVLGSLYEQVKADARYINNHASYHLKFLLREVANIMEFVDYAHTRPDELQFQHRYFIRPLLARVRRDAKLQTHLLAALHQSEHASIQISCYALLAKVVDGTVDLTNWKDEQEERRSSYGYNIVENRVMSLSETVGDIWY